MSASNNVETMTCDSMSSSIASTSTSSPTSCSSNLHGTGSEMQFPGKLHTMMEHVEKEGLENVIAWVHDGRAIMVNDPKKIVELLPKFFSQTKFRSFQRQLNMWHFERILKGPQKGAFRHPLFRKDNKKLCARMSRNIKDNQWKLQSNPILGGSSTATTGAAGGVAPPADAALGGMFAALKSSKMPTSLQYMMMNNVNHHRDLLPKSKDILSGGICGALVGGYKSSPLSSPQDCIFDNDALESVLDTAESLLIGDKSATGGGLLMIDDDIFDDDEIDTNCLFEGRRFHMVDAEDGQQRRREQQQQEEEVSLPTILNESTLAPSTTISTVNDGSSTLLASSIFANSMQLLRSTTIPDDIKCNSNSCSSISMCPRDERRNLIC